MLTKSEKNILKFIRFAPIVFIFLLSIFITYLFIVENKNRLKLDIKNLEMEYIRTQKQLVQNEVNRVYDYVFYEKETSETKLKKQIKDRVYEAHSIALNIYKENKEKSKEQILKLIKDALRDIRFNEERGYYFIHNIKGQSLLYPLDRSVEGSNFSQLKDINGYKFMQTIIQNIKDRSERYDTYYWNIPTDDPKDETNRIYKKIVFYKHFAPLNISIGTGEYIQDYETVVQKRILDYVSNIKYGEDGYVFIINTKGKILAHINDKLINTYLPKKKNKKNITDRLIEFAKNKDGFIKYQTIYHNKSRNSIEKTTYVKSFNNWKWILGSGFYRDRLDAQIEKRIKELDDYHDEYLLNIFVISSIVTLILLIISIYISNLIQNRFIKYRNKIYKEVDENRKKDTLLAQQSKMAAMGEMIGNIAHQWRQPLSLISTASTSLKLKEELGILEKEDIRKTSDVITDATKHLSKTIDDFRKFFKPNKEKTICTTTELWEKTYNLIKDQYKNMNIEIISNIKDDEVRILQSELIQVILNITNNSRDELLKLEENDVKFIFIDIYTTKNKLIIKIKDNAKGIPENIIDRIFEPYFTTKHQSQGTGIGLFMSQEIIKKHMQGSIEVQNSTFAYKDKPYTGALFTITIDFK